MKNVEHFEHLEFKWRTADGSSIYAQSWQPQEPIAVVCLVHGLGEHSGRYGHLAEYLNNEGYALLAFDLRGHGKSEGPKGHTPSYDVLLTDIDKLLDEAGERFLDFPCVLYGHSMGGNLVLNYALRRKPRRPEIAGIIATSPWLRLVFEPPKFKIALSKLMNRLWPSISQPNGLDTNGLSRDPEVVRAYKKDTLVHDRISMRLFVTISESGRWVIEHATEFPPSLPLLLMHGTGDRIASAKASSEFAKNMRERCTFKLWDGYYHELHNEPEQQKVFKFVLKWLKKRLRKPLRGKRVSV